MGSSGANFWERETCLLQPHRYKGKMVGYEDLKIFAGILYQEELCFAKSRVWQSPRKNHRC